MKKLLLLAFVLLLSAKTFAQIKVHQKEELKEIGWIITDDFEFLATLKYYNLKKTDKDTTFVLTFRDYRYLKTEQKDRMTYKGKINSLYGLLNGIFEKLPEEKIHVKIGTEEFVLLRMYENGMSYLYIQKIVTGSFTIITQEQLARLFNKQ